MRLHYLIAFILVSGSGMLRHRSKEILIGRARTSQLLL
jgi:hypothetical protein